MVSLPKMKVANTFFEQENYCTHRSHLPPKLPQMLDIFTVSQRGFSKARNCKTHQGIPSDHEAVELRLSLTAIKHAGKKKVSKGKTDWEKIRHNPAARSSFNQRLTELNQEFPPPDYSLFMTNIMRAGADTATKVIPREKGWFEEEKEVLLPKLAAQTAEISER